MVDSRLMGHIVCPFLCMLPATPYPVSSAYVCFYGEAFPDGSMILHLLGAAYRAWQHYFTLTVSGKTPGAARMRDQSPLLGVGGDMQSEVSAASCPIWVAVNMAPFGLLQITHYSSVCGASWRNKSCPHLGACGSRWSSTMQPVSRLLPDMNKDSFRQSVLSIRSLQICINRVFDVMPWSSPTYALSVCCADLQRTVRILIVSQ